MKSFHQKIHVNNHSFSCEEAVKLGKNSDRGSAKRLKLILEHHWINLTISVDWAEGTCYLAHKSN